MREVNKNAAQAQTVARKKALCLFLLSQDVNYNYDSY